jgi:hypothetical protein
MFLAIDFNYDPGTVGKEQQKVHPKPQQCIFPAFASGLGVPMKPHFGKQSRQLRIPVDVGR